MRIVGGKHRGRRLAAPDSNAVRPTADRTRESIFNILAHAGWGAKGSPIIEAATVLDVFCGTGALGLEALSRGAAFSYFLDASARSLELCRHNITELRENERAKLVKADASKPPAALAECSLLFLDPPYGKGLAVRALEALASRGWVAREAVCVIEMAASTPEIPPSDFAPLDQRCYGETAVLFCRYAPRQ